MVALSKAGTDRGMLPGEARKVLKATLANLRATRPSAQGYLKSLFYYFSRSSTPPTPVSSHASRRAVKPPPNHGHARLERPRELAAAVFVRICLEVVGERAHVGPLVVRHLVVEGERPLL